MAGDPMAGFRFYMLQQGGTYAGVPAAGIGEDIGDMDSGAGFFGQDEDIEVGASGQAAFGGPGRKPDFLERAVFPLQVGIPVQCHAGAKAVEAFGFLFQGEYPTVQVVNTAELFRIRVLHALYLYSLDQIHGACFSRLFLEMRSLFLRCGCFCHRTARYWETKTAVLACVCLSWSLHGRVLASKGSLLELKSQMESVSERLCQACVSFHEILPFPLSIMSEYCVIWMSGKDEEKCFQFVENNAIMTAFAENGPIGAGKRRLPDRNIIGKCGRNHSFIVVRAACRPLLFCHSA